MPSLVWDLFCRVVDNHGDLGVCLRLARHLAARGQAVRLWVDDPSALQWMATQPHEQAWAQPWPEGTWNAPQAGDVVIEAFGCHLPACVEHQLALRPPRAWINLEYLSAEAWVARSHGLYSPVMQGPAKGLSKRFCFPGFSWQTGGLLRPEATGLAGGQLPEALTLALEPARQHGGTDPVISLFCYPHAPLKPLFQRLCGQPCQVLVLGGADMLKLCQQACAELTPAQAANIRLMELPWLNQAQYDTLLTQCDLNIVRGEDSFMRAQWAGRPLLWHIYRQDDGAHADKLEAFLDTWLPAGAAHEAWRQAWRAWNGLLPQAALAQSQNDGLGPEGTAHALWWREQLLALPDLVDVLQHWALANPDPTLVDG